MPCFLARYSDASVGPNPRYTGLVRIATASRSVSEAILRFDGSPRSACTIALSPRRFRARSRRRTCRSVMPNSSAACFCVISFFLAFFKATSRSRSACVISSCPSATSPAWRSSIGHFYFAQIGHYHFAPTEKKICLDRQLFRCLNRSMPAALQIVQSPEKAGVLLQPGRLRLLEQLTEPDSAAGLARRLGVPRQKLNYHLRELEREGFLELVEERRKGN